jgi:hypothetical protein
MHLPLHVILAGAPPPPPSRWQRARAWFASCCKCFTALDFDDDDKGDPERGLLQPSR